MYLLFLGYLVILAVIDAKKKEFPFIICCTGLIPAVLCLWSRSEIDILSLLYGLIPGVVLLAIAVLSNEKVGFGDAIVLLLMGLALPFRQAYLAIVIAFVLAFVVAVFLLLFKKANKNTRMAFVPFLTVGTACIMLGEKMIYG